MNLDLNSIKGRRVLIIGDIMLDTYHIGEVKRISPEAPVPIVRVKRSYSVLGAAANVARNIIGLGATPTVLGICGNDDSAFVMRGKFEELGIEYALIENSYPTTTKTRVVGNDQQIVRIDFEQDDAVISSAVESKLKAKINEYLPLCDIVIISDYNKGVCSEAICQALIQQANKLDKMVVVDPKGYNWNRYKGATVITPNIKELSDVLGRSVKNKDSDIYQAAEDVLQKFCLTSLVVTRSERGISYVDKHKRFSIPTQAREVFDVSGAGDTVAATLAATLAAGHDINSAINIANKAAGVVVGKMGTSPILFDELQYELLSQKSESKEVTRDSLVSIVRLHRLFNRRILFTNGCFDILHKGHVKYLEEAKRHGDILIVGLNSDASVRRLKGEGRPINSEDARATVLAALECVDYVTLFDEDTPLELIESLRPDTLIKGGDYKIEDIVGREYAADTITIPFVDGFSTTSTIDKMR